MSSSFERLPEEKRMRIIKESLEEFVEYGFLQASTNRIVKKVGIAKGSLFNYFRTKDELWLYVAEEALQKVAGWMKEKLVDMPADILQRLRLMTGIIIDIYIENPLYFKFFMGVLDPGASHLQQALLQRNSQALMVADFFSGVDSSRFRVDESVVLLLVKWLYTGIKQELFALPEIRENPLLLKQEFFRRLEPVLGALGTGIYLSD